MPEDSNGEFKDKITEWRGYTLRALEDINRELEEVKNELKLCNTKIDDLNNKWTNASVKIAGIGGTVSLLVSLIMWLITRT